MRDIAIGVFTAVLDAGIGARLDARLSAAPPHEMHYEISTWPSARLGTHELKALIEIAEQNPFLWLEIDGSGAAVLKVVAPSRSG